MASARQKLDDVRLVEWTDRKSFYRTRSEWLRQARHDRELSDRAKVMLAEIGDRLSWDKTSAWPSGATLAAALGCGTATVTRSIEDAVARGWLSRERGGFSKSNHYAMSFSTAVADAVSNDHDERMQLRISASPFRSEVINMEAESAPLISITSDASFRSEVIDHVDHFRSIISISSDQLSSTVIQTSDPENLSKAVFPAKTEQDQSLRETILPSEGPSTVQTDIDDPDEWLRVEEELLAAIGKVAGGDLARGRDLARRLGPARLKHLLDLAHDRGIGGAGPDIFAAAQSAMHLETTSKSEVTT